MGFLINMLVKLTERNLADSSISFNFRWNHCYCLWHWGIPSQAISFLLPLKNLKSWFRHWRLSIACAAAPANAGHRQVAAQAVKEQNHGRRSPTAQQRQNSNRDGSQGFQTHSWKPCRYMRVINGSERAPPQTQPCAPAMSETSPSASLRGSVTLTRLRNHGNSFAAPVSPEEAPLRCAQCCQPCTVGQGHGHPWSPRCSPA